MFKTYAATWYGVKAQRRREAVAETAREERRSVLKVEGENPESWRSATPAAFGLAYLAAMSLGGTRR